MEIQEQYEVELKKADVDHHTPHCRGDDRPHFG